MCWRTASLARAATSIRQSNSSLEELPPLNRFQYAGHPLTSTCKILSRVLQTGGIERILLSVLTAKVAFVKQLLIVAALTLGREQRQSPCEHLRVPVYGRGTTCVRVYRIHPLRNW